MFTCPQITVRVGFRVVPSVTGFVLVHGGQPNDFEGVLVDIPPEAGQRGTQTDDEQTLLSGYRYDETDVFVYTNNNHHPLRGTRINSNKRVRLTNNETALFDGECAVGRGNPVLVYPHAIRGVIRNTIRT